MRIPRYGQEKSFPFTEGRICSMEDGQTLPSGGPLVFSARRSRRTSALSLATGARAIDMYPIMAVPLLDGYPLSRSQAHRQPGCSRRPHPDRCRGFILRFGSLHSLDYAEPPGTSAGHRLIQRPA